MRDEFSLKAQPATSPSPRLRGEGWGEGDSPQTVLVESPPHPDRRERSDLSPQAGRGDPGAHVDTNTSKAPAGMSVRRSFSEGGWPRLRPLLLAIAFPLALLAIWHFATVNRPASLIPPPYDVWLELRDLAFGGINDDAYSKTLHIHLLASIARVYGGFVLALAAALPLGMLIGRVPLVRQLVDPTIQILRPVPVTAWLPLAMIIFGLGPRSAFFLVFLGAFSDPGEHDFRRALGRAAIVRGGFHARLHRHRAILSRGAAGSTAVDLHRHAAEPRLCLGRDRGRRDDRRADGVRGHHHGSAPALAHRDRDFRHDRDRHLRFPVRPI